MPAQECAITSFTAMFFAENRPVAEASACELDRLVYGKLRASLGGDVRFSVSGGAPLGARLGHFFRGIGITVLPGTHPAASLRAGP